MNSTNGPLLKRILEANSAKANNTLKPEQRQLYLYAGHDSTVAHLLSALNVWDEQIPEYNSLVLLELHQLDQSGYGLKAALNGKVMLGAGAQRIKIIFRNTTLHEPYTLTIPGCEKICPLEKALLLTKDVIPSNLTEDCKPKDPNYVPPEAPEI